MRVAPRLLLWTSIAVAVSAQSMPAPSLPWVDQKACPFEGCIYREWTANRPVTVYDNWQEPHKEIGRLAKGDKVVAITGVVVTYRPGLIKMDRALPEQGLKAGDTILTYSYRGEGYSAVWFGGRYRSSYDISFARRMDGTGCGGAHCAATYLDMGQQSWWAQVKLKSGATGWVDMDNAFHMPFDGVDMLA